MLSDISTAIVATVSVLPALAILTVVLRLSVRKVKRQTLTVDDYLIVAALIVLTCGCAGYIAGAVVGGIGFHLKTLEPHTVITFLKFIFALQFQYLVAVTVIKLSVLLLYKRIFFSHTFGVAVNVMCGLVLGWFITFFFATLLQTLPISGNWALYGSMATQGNSINVYAMYISAAVLEITLDIITLILPLFVIWRLHMHTARKWQVSGIFLLGSFVCVASILRLYYLIKHLNPTAEEEEDLTYNLGNIVLWSAIEPLVGLICACLPTLGPIFQRRTLQSFLQSLGSLFNLRSTGSTMSQPSGPTRNRHTETKARPFYPIDDQQNLVTTVESQAGHGKSNEYLPLQSIRVNESLQSDVEQRSL